MFTKSPNQIGESCAVFVKVGLMWVLFNKKIR